MIFDREKRHIRAVAILVLMMVCAIFVAILNYRTPYAGLLKLNGNELNVLLANTEALQIQGLSDRDSLPGYDGMYFPFQYRGEHAMVMRRMHFSLDMVWLNDGKIVQILENLPPEPNRTEEELTIYSNTSSPATAVLEMPSGYVKKYGIKVGDVATLKERVLPW
jgi:uncharacterized membrane protein (UPF0127 family)